MSSLRRSPLNLESLEDRDAPAFVLSLSTAPSYTTLARPAAPATTLVSSYSLVNTTVPINWSQPGGVNVLPGGANFTVPLNWYGR